MGLVPPLSLIRRSKACLQAVWLISLLAMAGTSQASVTIDGTLTDTDPTQSPRLFRSGTPTNATLGNPGVASVFSSGSFAYDAHSFINSTGTTQLYTVVLGSAWPVSAFIASYLDSFDPANITVNHLANPGSSNANLSFTFEVANGDTFFVVVHSVANASPGMNIEYSFTIPEYISGPPPEELSAQTTGLPMANAQGPMLINASQTVTGDINNHLFGLMAGDGEEAANDGLAAAMDDGVIVGQGDGPEDPIARKVKRSRQWEVFTTVNYGNVKLSAVGTQAGVQTDAWAPSIGIQRHLSSGLALGFAASFLTSDQSYTGGLGSLHLEGPALSAYLTFVRKNFWNSLLYSFGTYELDSTRNPGFAFPQAFGTTRTYTNSVQYNTGWNFRFQNNTLVTGPFAGIDYLHGSVDAYNETGGGLAALRYNKQSFESLVTRVGWAASKKIRTSWATITPQVRLSYERQNLKNNGTSVSLINAPFTATGGNQSPGQDYMVLGTGVNFAFNDQCSLLLGYQAQFFRQDQQAHFGSVRIGWKF